MEKLLPGPCPIMSNLLTNETCTTPDDVAEKSSRVRPVPEYLSPVVNPAPLTPCGLKCSEKWIPPFLSAVTLDWTCRKPESWMNSPAPPLAHGTNTMRGG